MFFIAFTERERRHFSEKRGYEQPAVRGRRYFSHGQGSQPDWQPHPHHLQVKYSEYVHFNIKNGNKPAAKYYL